MSNIKPLFIIVLLIVISLIFGANIRSITVGFVGNIVNFYHNTVSYVDDKISEFVFQSKEIKRLRIKNKELLKSANLLSTFANELDKILLDKNSTFYEPKVKLIKALNYANLTDYNKIWVNFDDFNVSKKAYGLISNGKTAGILVQKDNKPLAILQKDEKSIFSVFIGKDKIPGFANGNSKNITVKYIPQWLEPKIGDDVYTSGLDGIFFSGILVGKVIEIQEQDLYKTAIVDIDNKIDVPSYLYVITQVQ